MWGLKPLEKQAYFLLISLQKYPWLHYIMSWHGLFTDFFYIFITAKIAHVSQASLLLIIWIRVDWKDGMLRKGHKEMDTKKKTNV